MRISPLNYMLGVYLCLLQDQGLVLFSESPDVCYVRSLNGQKTKCKGGYDTKKKVDISLLAIFL